MAYSEDTIALPADTLSVAGLTRYLQDLLAEDEQLLRVWVLGEVSSASDRGGHLFFTLQEADGSAALNCVVWRSQRHHLTSEPVAGEQILVLGQVRLYPQRSAYQLMGFQILPAGAGLAALRRQQLRDRLMAEGLFDPDQKQPLPVHPQTIAVVTSPQAAAWGDIQRTLKQRYPGLHVLLSSAVVQGAQAPASIAAAIGRAATDPRPEVIILARGGGAREDLDCFDDERVVRAIVTCPIPVITGIGHQRDECLADLAADYCAHTPTAAAELITAVRCLLGPICGRPITNAGGHWSPPFSQRYRWNTSEWPIFIADWPTCGSINSSSGNSSASPGSSSVGSSTSATNFKPPSAIARPWGKPCTASILPLSCGEATP
jgi:exodeoxyribonuclease VII large subunit